MVEQGAPARRRRMGAHGQVFRRRRVFAWLREGLTYDEIAAEEGVTPARIRQIVAAELKQRAVDSGADHAKLQLDRLAPAVQLGAEAIAAGNISAITPYLRALDRLDRYQTVAGAEQDYDDEARRKLMEKINRLAANLGLDDPVAVTAPEMPSGEPGEAEVEGEGQGTDQASAPEAGAELAPGSGFFYLNRP